MKSKKKSESQLSEAEIFELKKKQLELMKMQLELVEGLPALRQFKQIPGMEASFRNYWGSKNELEYSDMILKYLEKVG